MFDTNIFNGLEPLKIYLTKPDSTLLYCLNSFIDKDSAQLSPKFNQCYNITFNIYRYINDRKGNLIEFDGYDYIVDGMYLAVEKYGSFRINNPESVKTPDEEYKIVTATSCNYELVQKSFNYQINMGTETSLEYLVEYEEGEQEKLVDPYTGIPYDWVLLYNTIPEQLNNFKSKLDSGYFGIFTDSTISVTDTSKIEEIVYILDLVKRLKRTITYDEAGEVSSSTENFGYIYDENNEITTIVIYDTINSRLTEVITYYNKYHKQLSLLDFISDLTDGNWTIGDVYGLSDGDYTYANKKMQFDEDGTIYSFLTQSLARAIECVPIFDIVNRTIGIQPVEYLGENTGGIIGFNKLVNSLNIACDENNLITKLYVYGEDDLSIEQVNFGREYIEDLSYMVNARDSDGNRIYVSDSLASKYLQYKEYQEINRADYIVLTKEYNQYLKDIDELKYRVPNDSLSTNWGSYTLDELETALTTYKNLLASLISLYKEDYGSAGCNEDGSVNEDYIRNTEYWYDYYAYVNTIKQIEVAINTYPNYNNESKWTETQQAQYEGVKDDYLTEWSLYGSVELKVKIDSYASRLEILISSGSVIKKEDSEYEIKTWDELTDLEKEDYLTEQSYTDSYDMYMEYYNNMTEAQTYLDSILAEISDLEEKQNICKTQLDEIKKQVSWEVYFTSDERKILNKLLYEGEYNNNNILVTSINDVVDSVDIAKELLLDGQEKLSILSRPQLIFSTELSNLFGLVEFESLWKDFKILNYILVQYKDNQFAKLRLTGFTFNPLIPSTQTITVSFSNMVSSKTKIDDTASILGLSSTEGLSTYGSGSSSGGNGSSGLDTVSNTMLEKLLNSETFGTRVTNVILDTMSANLIQTKKAIIGSSAGDNTEIDGKRITTGWIMSGGYNGNKDTGSINNTKGSIINLENDCFNLGGGSIIYDGTVLKFGEDVSISWSNVTGTGNVASKDDIPSEEQITQITKNTVTTSYVNALEVKAKEVSADWVYAGNVTADQIKTGKLTSKDGTSTVFDLDNNTFNLGTSLSYANNKLTLGDDVVISWSQVSGTDGIATKDDVNNAIIEAGGITEDQVTEISRNEIKSAKISADQIYGNTLTLGGAGNANGTLVIKDADGNAIVTGNNEGLVISKGSISWSNVTGTDNVASKDDIPDDEYITQITKDTVTSAYIKTLNLTVGNEIQMGENATISWNQVTDKEIGTRNYVSKSGNYKSGGETGWVADSASYFTVSVEDGYTRITRVGTGTSTSYVKIPLVTELTKGEIYTLSMRLRKSVVSDLKILYRKVYNNGSSTVTGTLVTFASSEFTADGWVDLSYTFTSGDTYSFLLIRSTEFPTEGETIDFEYMQLEKGSVVSDWKAASEDIENSIPDDEYITEITKNTITTSYIKTLNLTVGNEIKMGENATISWSQVTGTDDVATKDDVNNAIIEAGGITEEQVTEISRNEIKTAKIGADQIYGNTLTLGGEGNANGTLVIKDVDGNAIVTGDKDGLFIEKGTISWNNVSNTENVATKDDVSELDFDSRNFAIGTSDEWVSEEVTDNSNCCVVTFVLNNMADKNLKAGDILQVGVDLKFSDDFVASGNGTKTSIIQGNINYGGTYTNMSMSGGNKKSDIETIISSESKEGHINTYVVVTENMIDGTYSGNWIINIRFDYYSGTMYYRNQMVNRGNKEASWQPAPEDTDEALDNMNETITEQSSSIIGTCEEIVLEACKKYVETGDFEEFKETVTSQLSVQAEDIEMNFTKTTESIEEVNGDLQSTKSELSKYIRYSIDGIEIGEEGSALTLHLDNDMIEFRKNGTPIGWWDGDDFHTGNIMVEVNERAQFGNFAFVPRSDGSLMFLKVGES